MCVCGRIRGKISFPTVSDSKLHRVVEVSVGIIINFLVECLLFYLLLMPDSVGINRNLIEGTW